MQIQNAMEIYKRKMYHYLNYDVFNVNRIHNMLCLYYHFNCISLVSQFLCLSSFFSMKIKILRENNDHIFFYLSFRPYSCYNHFLIKIHGTPTQSQSMVNRMAILQQ